MTNKLRFSKTYALFTLILLIFISTASGATIYGPEKLVRSDGAPDVFTRAVETTAGTGKLIVKNGEDNGEKRIPYSISSARITLNGTEILGPSDFNQTVYALEADIDLNQSNSLIVELASQPGDFLTVSIEQVISSPISINIISPVDGSTTGKPDIMVKGTIDNSLGNETGVAVNGVLAKVDGNNFTANHVQLEEGINVLEMIATDSQENTSNISVNVNQIPDTHFIRLSTNKESGISPFEATLKLDGSFNFIAQPPTYAGPGYVDITSDVEPNEFAINITAPGIYYFTSEVGFNGTTYSDTIAIRVMDKAQLDALLKAKWNGMKTALIDGDFEKALSYHHIASREKYSFIYNLPEIDFQALAQQMQEIEMVFEEADMAQYRIKRNQNINGQQHDITYYIYFSINDKGLWVIESY